MKNSSSTRQPGVDLSGDARGARRIEVGQDDDRARAFLIPVKRRIESWSAAGNTESAPHVLAGSTELSLVEGYRVFE